jgi:hypothetical protein
VWRRDGRSVKQATAVKVIDGILLQFNSLRPDINQASIYLPLDLTGRPSVTVQVLPIENLARQP